MLLTPPLPYHKLSHLLGPPPPSSVTYFMDGPYLLNVLIWDSFIDALSKWVEFLLPMSMFTLAIRWGYQGISQVGGSRSLMKQLRIFLISFSLFISSKTWRMVMFGGKYGDVRSMDSQAPAARRNNTPLWNITIFKNSILPMPVPVEQQMFLFLPWDCYFHY